eukprot:scaffold3418_cov124-Isochrysis_galbana.AAC.11
MTSEPVLMPPREDKPFIVKTDGASTLGIGGVLTQKDDDGRWTRTRSVAYYGRALQAAERNWTVTEIELLAALESIRNWRPYLWGVEINAGIGCCSARSSDAIPRTQRPEKGKGMGKEWGGGRRVSGRLNKGQRVSRRVAARDTRE